MELAEAAALARMRGETDHVASLLLQAFEYEKEAANQCAQDISLEPTRSVLHRSAAVLALQCGEYREAERLIARGLSGEPPDEIAEELRDLLEQVYFERHLSLRGLSLEPTEVQLSIAGPTVGYGMVLTDEFVGRVQTFERLIVRTAERKLGLPYRESGLPTKDIRENFAVVMSVPRAASFAVSLKIARPETQQLLLPGFEGNLEAKEIVDDILDGLFRLNTGDDAAVRQQIPEEAYFKNFVGLAKELVPDGKQIRAVGLTTDGERGRQLLLDRPRNEIAKHLARTPAPDAGPIRIRVRGALLFADARALSRGVIKVVDSDGTEHKVVVPEGLMSDIVRPLWDSEVEVEGLLDSEGIHMEDIRRAGE
jgi:hypothetical protein